MLSQPHIAFNGERKSLRLKHCHKGTDAGMKQWRGEIDHQDPLPKGSGNNQFRVRFAGAFLEAKLDPSGQFVDYYQLLSISHHASSAEIKAAYHHKLLQSHPDKHRAHATSSEPSHSISMIQEAYRTLSDPGLRSQYDGVVSGRAFTAGPRPAQVISLEEFEGEADGDGKGDESLGAWRYACRCGGFYRIQNEDMEKDQHLVACNSCSEVVWVGYEISEDDAPS